MEEKEKNNLLEEISIYPRLNNSLRANNPSLVMNSIRLLNLINKEDKTYYV